MPEQRVLVTADLHLDHTNIIKYCNRPFANVEEMNETIIARWNETIQRRDDTVFHVGDLGLGTLSHIKSLFERLQGSKALIRGNHDSTKMLKALAGAGVHNLGTEYIWPVWRGNGNVNVRMQHRPPRIPVKAREYCLYGHLHNTPHTRPQRSLCMSVELWDYRPQPLDELLAEIDRRDAIEYPAPTPAVPEREVW